MLVGPAIGGAPAGTPFPMQTTTVVGNKSAKLVSFKNFCPYQIDLDNFKDARGEFTTEEWIDVILGAVDYNAAGYQSEEEKLTMICELEVSDGIQNTDRQPRLHQHKAGGV